MKTRIVLGIGLVLFLTNAAVAQVPTPAGSPTDDFIRAEPAETLPPPLGAALAGLPATALSAHIGFLASPALEGRGLGSRGLEAAAEYAASQLALAGVAPLVRSGDGASAHGTYFQEVPMREIRAPGGGVELVWGSGGSTQGRSFLSGVDCLVPAGPPRTLTAPLVFAGWGIRETSPGRDDWKGLDVRGKIVVVREGLPPGDAWLSKELVARYAAEDAEERWAYRLEIAQKLGALAVLAVEGDAWTTRLRGKDKPWPFAFRGLVDPEHDGSGAEPVLVRVSPAVAAVLESAKAGRERAGEITVTIRTTGQETLTASRNVIGFLEGSDPALKREAVVIGAHLDHLGKLDGVVYPGADDNASGVAALLEIARAFAGTTNRPKRSLVFAFWTGEEEDKIGSAFYVQHPPWPLARTVAYLNLDMVGHGWTTDEMKKLVAEAGPANGEEFLAHATPANFFEPGVASFAPQLVPILARAGRGAGIPLHLDRTDGSHGGSDYRAFARARVPFVRFFGNFFPAYHEPGDTPDLVDVAQVRKAARLAMATAWLLADR